MDLTPGITAKSNLRRQFLQQRRALSVDVWQRKSEQICDHLRSSAWFRQAKTILAYFSIRQEPDLMFLIQHDSDHRWGFSRCQNNTLLWHHWSPSDPLATGQYGIQEPLPTAPCLQPADVDLMLIPAVACDRRGYRLGYGGGYYDRLLAEPDWQSKPTIGIVFDHAYVATLPVDPWDRPLQAICTENGLFPSPRGETALLGSRGELNKTLRNPT
ncbi:5-formyltetrahydrofolate cyclo-ligase [Trichothermofontia sp.]